VNLLMFFQLSRVILRFSKSSMALFYISGRAHVDVQCVYTAEFQPPLLLRPGHSGVIIFDVLPFHISEVSMPVLLLRGLVC